VFCDILRILRLNFNAEYAKFRGKCRKEVVTMIPLIYYKKCLFCKKIIKKPRYCQPKPFVKTETAKSTITRQTGETNKKRSRKK
jgi:hypothetical protein